MDRPAPNGMQATVLPVAEVAVVRDPDRAAAVGVAAVISVAPVRQAAIPRAPEARASSC